MIELPATMCCAEKTLDSLIGSIYNGISDNTPKDDQYFLDRTILCGINKDVDAINDIFLDKLYPNVQKHVKWSVDSVNLPDDGNGPRYPIEFLQSLTASGLPLAKLILKAGAPIMALRNLDPSIGLCNGTRMIVEEVRQRVLKCRIITGDAKFAGNTVFIPRIALEPSDKTLPVPLRCLQFPVRLSFSMTINKSQGQGLGNVGLYLQTPVFSHGQLYVALSRCTSADRIKILLPEDNTNNKTRNIVYRAVFRGLQM